MLASEGLRVEIAASLCGSLGVPSKRGQAWISETDLTALAGDSDADCDGFGGGEPSRVGDRPGHGAACSICKSKSENARYPMIAIPLHCCFALNLCTFGACLSSKTIVL